VSDTTRTGDTVIPDDRRITELYEREFARAARLAHLLTGSNDAAEDIAQDAFLRVGPRLDAVDDPSRYLTTTVVNLCRNWHRGAERERARAVRAARREAVAEPSIATTSSDDTSEHDDVLDVVDRLPFRQRTVLVARYWLDLPEAEIATLLGCRPGTVKSLASRALATLRKELS
jgi:RNA polymerase sigma factor (sigma-70 family)